MKRLSQRIWSSLPAIFIFTMGIIVLYVQLDSMLYPFLYERFALYSPTFEEGVNYAQPLISELKMYKAEFQHYPPDLGELPATKELFLLIFIYKYKYEPNPTTEKPQEYMLSFRKRWSTSDWYCYYSGDRAWLQSSDPCWDTIRSMHGLKISQKDYH